MKKAYGIDTHSLLWYYTKDPQLSDLAKKTIASVIKEEATGYVSSIVVAEAIHSLLKKEKKEEKAEHSLVNPFLAELFKRSYVIVDVPVEHVLKLKDYLNKEYYIEKRKSYKRFEIHDALIVILAQELNVPLITKDEVITASALVEVVW